MYTRAVLKQIMRCVCIMLREVAGNGSDVIRVSRSG